MDIPYKEVELKDVRFMDEPFVDGKPSPIAFDVETIGLYGRIRLAQFYQEGWEHVLLVNNPNPIELAVLIQKANLIIQNASYEISTIQAAIGGFYEPNNYEDTFYLARLKYYSKTSFALDSIMDYVLGYDPYKQAGLDKKEMQNSNWDVIALTKKQKIYASIDVFHLIEVFDAVKSHLDDTSYKLDMLALHHAVRFQCNGMPVLNDEVQKQYKKNLNIIEEIDLPVNSNSWKQVRPYIGSEMSDGLGLATLTIEGNTRARDVQTVRKALKQNSFLTKFDTPENRIYGKFLPSARSGRFTCKDQNLEQIPRETKYCFGYNTEDGRVLVYADYAQLEMRCLCAITGESVMDKLLCALEDLHDFTATMLFGKGFTKEQRQIAKTANFNLVYGGGHNMLGSILITDAGIMLSEPELRAIKRKWLNLYPTVAAWQQRGISAWRNGTAWQTPFGRKYNAKMMTDQLNIVISGFGAEVAKLAMHYMEPLIEEAYGDGISASRESDVGMANFIHDSYIYDCPNNEEVYTGVAHIVADSMQKAWFEALRTGIDLKIRDLPMPVEVFVGYNWGRIEKDYLYKYELEGMRHHEDV